jgi:hypothetical protein
MTKAKKVQTVMAEKLAKAISTPVETKRAVNPNPNPRVITSAACPTPEDVAKVYAPVDQHARPAVKAAGRSATKLVESEKPIGKAVAEKRVMENVAAEKSVAYVALNKAVRKGDFQFVKTETSGKYTAFAYVHQDDRAVLITVGPKGDAAWALKSPDGSESGGKDAALLTEALKASRATLLSTIAAKKSLQNRAAHKAAQEAKQAVVDAKFKADLPPAHVVRAIEMAGGITLQRFDIHELTGDKHYGHRVQLLKKLLQTDKILVADSGVTKLVSAFYSAVGTGDGTTAAKREEFTKRCRAIGATSRVVKAQASRAEKKLIQRVKYTSAGFLDSVVPGKILTPPSKPPSKEARREELNATARELLVLSVTAEPYPVPKADVTIEVVRDEIGLLRDPGNGVIMLQMERENSQGAICVYNNEKRIAAGVIPLSTLKTLRPVSGEVDLVDVVNQLLNPSVPSVPVSPVAARLLNQILQCKEINPMATAKKSKKFEANAKAPIKAVKASKPAKAVKAAAGPRKASMYRLLTAAKKTWAAFGGQKKQIVDTLVKAGAVGAKAPGLTTAELVEKTGIAGKNVAFYTSTLQKTDPPVLEKLAAA